MAAHSAQPSILSEVTTRTIRTSRSRDHIHRLREALHRFRSPAPPAPRPSTTAHTVWSPTGPHGGGAVPPSERQREGRLSRGVTSLHPLRWRAESILPPGRNMGEERTGGRGPRARSVSPVTPGCPSRSPLAHRTHGRSRGTNHAGDLSVSPAAATTRAVSTSRSLAAEEDAPPCSVPGGRTSPRSCAGPNALSRGRESEHLDLDALVSQIMDQRPSPDPQRWEPCVVALMLTVNAGSPGRGEVLQLGL